jgi:hypothetical protein
MKYISNIRITVILLVASLFASGFLGFCEKNVTPCSVKIDNLINGTVFSPDTGNVTIKGTVASGSDGKIPLLPVSLKANGSAVVFNKMTGKFEYTVTPDLKQLYQTIVFELSDSRSNKSYAKSVFAIGNSAEPGARSVVESAYKAKVILPAGSFAAYKQQKINELTKTPVMIEDFVNTWKKDRVYGMNDVEYGSKNSASPYPAGIFPKKYTDPKDNELYLKIGGDNTQPHPYPGFFNIGKVKLFEPVQLQNGSIQAKGIDIDAESWVGRKNDLKIPLNLGFMAFGKYHEDKGRRAVFMWAEKVQIRGDVNVTLSIDAANNVSAKIIFNSYDIVFSGNKGMKINEDWDDKDFGTWKDRFVPFIMDTIKPWLIETLSMDIPLTKLDDSILAKDLGLPHIANFVPLMANSDMLVANWNTNEPQFSINENQYNIILDMGISSKNGENSPNIVPGLAKFYYTELEDVDLSAVGEENLVLALNDEIINNIFFVDMQVGHLKDLLASDELENSMKTLGIPDYTARIDIDVPPIVDFRAPENDDANNPKTSGRGILIARDIRVEIFKNNESVAVASIDLDAPLVFSADSSKFLHADIYAENTKSSIIFLSEKIGKPAIMVELKKELIKEAIRIIGNTAQSNIDFNMPALSIFSKTPTVEIKGYALAGNAQIIRLLVK